MGETLDKTQDNIIAQETKRAAEAGVITSEQATKDGIAAIEKALASGKNVPQNELIKLEEQANKQMKAKILHRRRNCIRSLSQGYSHITHLPTSL